MKHLITIACLTGAVAMYTLSYENSAAVLGAAGLLFELAF
ncbi:hypothetical protein LT85_4198 [Collimonas arenae]|uniref:Uncharacterized protein n=1 Tax=Collimonas arenae TaxID=279058 RepID=A0A0A1FFR8_9BURK|nr:hypothetical protein LT85_4198 [Collimonas arenae]